MLDACVVKMLIGGDIADHVGCVCCRSVCRDVWSFVGMLDDVVGGGGDNTSMVCVVD